MITNEAINRAITYIMDHINEDLSVERIAAHCNFSRFYFSRMFKIETGESIGAFIRRVKIEQSAFRLKVDQSRSITDIGNNYGYSSSNYSTLFKQFQGASPTEFRQGIVQKSQVNPYRQDEQSRWDTLEECNQKVTIEILNDFSVIYQRYKGNYGDLSLHWDSFHEKYHEYITEQTLFFERTYDDPNITDVNSCLFEICMTAPSDCQLENTAVLCGGKFAVYHFADHVTRIYAAYQSLFNIWLPQHQCEIDERYGFDIYRDVDCETMDMKIDICIPIK